MAFEAVLTLPPIGGKLIADSEELIELIITQTNHTRIEYRGQRIVGVVRMLPVQSTTAVAHLDFFDP